MIEDWDELVSLAESGYQNTPAKEFESGWMISPFPLLPGKPLIIGSNPGGGTEFGNQTEYPTIESELYKSAQSWKYYKSIKNFLQFYMKLSIDPPNFNYSNLCPYRTRNTKVLKIEDVNNGFAVFQKLYTTLTPPWIISTSIDNARYLLYAKRVLTDVRTIKTSNMKIVIGKLWETPFIAIPHPNAFITAQERRLAWKTAAETFNIT